MTTPESNPASSLEWLVTSLVPMLSRSLAERFNVFRVMHHGTHEKQISNVFAWLLRADGTHGFGDTFQQMFVEQVNRTLPVQAQLPATGYIITQEVDTSGREALGKDIADIVLSCPLATIVVENFESSDGHGHGYNQYLKHGTTGGKQSVVVLLCGRHEAHLQNDGWEEAVVLTYADLLAPLKALVAENKSWRRAHPQQHFFICQLLDHFMEDTGNMSEEEKIEFIKVMCETGESARYAQRPHEAMARQFAELLAQHAQRQFEEGRAMLGCVKNTLKRFSAKILADQVNTDLGAKDITSVDARYVCQWEWCVTLRRAESKPEIFFEFGPTAVVENGRVAAPLAHPDYSKVFVTRRTRGSAMGIDLLIQTDVGMGEVLAGLSPEDVRLRDGVLAAIRAD